MLSRFEEKIKDEISRTVCIDFDGVIHKNSKGYHDGTIYDDPFPGTEEALQFLVQKYRLIIFTCKASPDRPLVNGKSGISLVWEWLHEHNLSQYIFMVTDRKPRALFYIDDKGITFSSWAQTLIDIEKHGNIDDPSKY